MIQIGDIAVYYFPCFLVSLALVFALLAYIAFNARRKLWRLPGLLAALMAPLLMGATYTGLPIALTNSSGIFALTNYPSWQYFAVLRLGVNTPGDAPAQWFIPTSTTCSIIGGDVGSENPTADGGCFNAVFGGSADAREWGADKTGVADSTTAVQNALNNGPPIISLPAGTFSLSALTMTGNGQRIQCTAPRATILAQNTTSGNLITMSGRWNQIDQCFFEPTVRVTGVQVAIAYGCYHCSITNYEMAYTFDGISDQAGGATIGDYDSQSIMGSIYGKFGILFQGINSTEPASGLTLNNVLVNNAYPVNSGNGNEVVTWAPSTAYVAGDITDTNTSIYQETASTCTSASSGSGPSGFPSGTSPYNIFTSTISDGSCTWLFVSNNLLGFVNNSWGNSAVVNDFVTLNNFECIVLLDTNNPGTNSGPQFPIFKSPQCDHNYSAGINIEGGFDTQVYFPYVGSDFTSDGILFGGSFNAIGTVMGGRVADNWMNGIFLAVGSQFTIQGTAVGSNSQAGSGLFNNITVAPNISQFNINNNFTGKDPEAANAFAKFGVIIQAGTSDYYNVTGNICAGNIVTSCVSDGGTGTHKSVPTSGNGANW